MVPKWRRCDGEFQLAVLSQKVDGFFTDFRVDGSFFFEAREQFAHGARIEQSTGKAMLADLAGLLEHISVFFAKLRTGIFLVVLVNELRETNGTRHSCGAPAYDNDIGGHLGAVDAFKRFAENQHKENLATDCADA